MLLTQPVRGLPKKRYRSQPNAKRVAIRLSFVPTSLSVSAPQRFGALSKRCGLTVLFYLHTRMLEGVAKLAKDKNGGSLTAMPIAESEKAKLAAYIPTD